MKGSEPPSYKQHFLRLSFAIFPIILPVLKDPVNDTPWILISEIIFCVFESYDNKT